MRKIIVVLAILIPILPAAAWPLTFVPEIPPTTIVTIAPPPIGSSFRYDHHDALRRMPDLLLHHVLPCVDLLLKHGPVLVARRGNDVAVLPVEKFSDSPATFISLDRKTIQSGHLTLEVAEKLKDHLKDGNVGLVHQVLTDFFDSSDAVSTARW